MLHERIRRARILRGMSLQDLANAIGDITKQALSKYEAGRDMPGSARILQLSEALGLKPEYFFRPNTVTLGHLEFRKQTKLTKTNQGSIEEQAREHLERYIALEGCFEADALAPSFDQSHAFPVHSPEEVELAAEKLREEWSIGLDAIQNLTELLEDHGIKVIEIEAPDPFDGLSAQVEGSDHIVVMVNRAKPGERQRFTAAHELGHLVMKLPHDLPEKECENWCHRFAGAFLFPQHKVHEEFGLARGHVHVQELLLAKRAYGISMQATLRRLLTLNIISEATYRFMMMRFGQWGYRRKEPGELVREEPIRFQWLVYRGLAEGLFTPAKAAEFLQISLSELEQSDAPEI